MSIAIKTFTASTSVVSIELTSDSALTSAEITLNDGTVMDILSSFSLIGTEEYGASVNLDYPDGVLVLSCVNASEGLTVSIGNLLQGTQFLLKQALQDKYDCVLFQQLEACRQLIIGNEGFVAQDLYFDIQNHTATCENDSMLTFAVAGTSIWIEESKYIVK